MAATVSLADLPDELRELLEGWLVEFDQSWDEGRLAARVRELPADHPLRLAAVAEMIKIDQEHRWRRGDRVPLESYLRDYPDLGTPETVPADLVLAEYELRRELGDEPSLAEFEARFPRQAGDLGRHAGPVNPSTVVSGDAGTMSPPAAGGSAAGPPAGRIGRYKLIRPLGQGGMGTVYLAHDPQLDRPVALKVPLVAAGDAAAVGRFYREARAAAALRHPHICPVYDVGEADGVLYLTMAYIEGRTLADAVRAGPPMAPGQAAALVRQLALALEVAHRHGVIHRDLKPANVMLNADGEPMIMDFGLARRVNREDERITQSGAVMGTPAFMSPEQVSGDVGAVGPASDVYSLGVILYELLTGQLPFRGPMGSVMVQIATTEPERPSRLRPDLSPQLEGVVMVAMAKKVEDRYQTMGQFAAALADYLRAEEGGAKPVNRVAPLLTESAAHAPTAAHPAPAPPRRGRRRTLIAAGLLAGLALVVGGIIILIKDKDGKVVQKIPVKDLPPGGGKLVVTDEQGKVIGEVPLPKKTDGNPPVDAKKVAAGPLAPKLVRQLSLPGVQGWRPQGWCHLDISPDGKTLAARNGSTVELWDLDTGKRRADLKDHPGRVNHLEFGPDGKKLAVGCYKQVFVWDVAKARDPLVLRGHTDDVVYAHFAPDGKTLLSLSDDHTLRRWDAATGEELGTLLKNVSNSYCKLSPDGKTLFVERGLLDLGTLEWRVLERIDYRSLQFSRDGRWLGEANGERVGLWDLGARKYQPVHQLHTARVDSVVLCPDGKTVASGSADKTVILYDLEAKKARAVIKAHPGPVEWVWVLPDGKTLASYSQSDPAVKFWDVATGADRGGLANDHNLKFVYYTADSPWMVVTVDQKDNAKVWDLAGGAAGDRKGGDR